VVHTCAAGRLRHARDDESAESLDFADPVRPWMRSKYRVESGGTQGMIDGMHVKWRMLVALSAGVLSLALAVHAQQPTFRSVIRTVDLYATVTDESNRLITDLSREAFEVFDNGQRQEITVFDNVVRPVTVVVMLDTSISMTLRLEDLYAGAEQFLLRLLPHDRAMLGAFNDKIQFTSEFSGDRDMLVASIRDLNYGNETRLYDAVHESLDRLRGQEGRKVLLLFTDGEDYGSQRSSGRGLERARDEDVMIYGIGLETDYFNGQRQVRSSPDRILNRYAGETGGGYFDLKKDADLNSAFTRIAQELRSQYLIGISPAVLDGKVHQVEVRATSSDYKVRSRRSYLASPDTD
jgi:VWFA-related protein